MRLALLSAIVAVLLAQGGGLLHAGFPAKCEKSPCGMKMCDAIGKNGKPNGMNCSHRCTKQCCLCAKSCPRDEYRGEPEEGQ